MKKKNQKSKDEIIADLLIKKYSYEQIKELLHTGNTRISRVASQLKNNVENIESAKIGRPLKTTPKIVQIIEEETIRDPTIGGVSLSSIIANAFGVQLSSSTINMIRNNLKFRYIHPRRRSFMTEKHIQNRIEFCQKQIQDSIIWENFLVYFGNEDSKIFNKLIE